MKYATLIVASLLMSACGGSVGGSSTGGPTPHFEIRDLKWLLEKETYSFTYTGKGEVRTSDTTNVYLVAVEVVRTKRLSPSQQADTTSYAFVVQRGRAPIELSEYASRCREFSTQTCIKEAQEPEMTLRVLGWTRFAKPASTP